MRRYTMLIVLACFVAGLGCGKVERLLNGGARERDEAAQRAREAAEAEKIEGGKPPRPPVKEDNGKPGSKIGKPEKAESPPLEQFAIPPAVKFVLGETVTVEGEVVMAARLGDTSRVFGSIKEPNGRLIHFEMVEGSADQEWFRDTRRGDTLKVSGVVKEVSVRSAELSEVRFVSQQLRGTPKK